MRYFLTSKNEQGVIALMIVMIARFRGNQWSNMEKSGFLYTVVDFVESIAVDDSHERTIIIKIK